MGIPTLTCIKGWAALDKNTLAVCTIQLYGASYFQGTKDGEFILWGFEATHQIYSLCRSNRRSNRDVCSDSGLSIMVMVPKTIHRPANIATLPHWQWRYGGWVYYLHTVDELHWLHWFNPPARHWFHLSACHWLHWLHWFQSCHWLHC